MTNAQTEARAIVEEYGKRPKTSILINLIATALAAKDAQLAEANKVLEPFARIADEYGDEEDDFQIWKDFDVLGASLPLKHFRAARRAREAQGGENG